MRQPLGALRTFVKLLERRLERDPEGLNHELAKNVLIQSDELVELLRRYEASGAEDEEDWVDDSSGNGGEAFWIQELEAQERGNSSSSSSSSSSSPGTLADSSGSSGTEKPRLRKPAASSASLTLSDLRAVLAPILAAAQAISSRDGVAFSCFVEDGLPRLYLDERGFQEALGTMIELALASSLAAAATAAAAADAAPKAAPAVSLEVRTVQGRERPQQRPAVTFIVRDNGLGDTSTGRGGKELGLARKAIERMNARLEIRRSESLGGTHMAVLFDDESSFFVDG